MIHYHGTPMTPAGDMVKSFSGKHAMVSFERPDQIEVAAEICQSVVLDNGAFSAWKNNVPHDFYGYEKWAEKWLLHPSVDWAVIPDVIDGDEKENDEMLARWGLPCHYSVPVWHLHESLDRLKRLCDGRYPRVALGSSGKFSFVGDIDWWKRMSEAMRTICDSSGRPIVRLHGLRMLDPGVFSRLPLASADSCNVARNVGLDDRWTGAYAPQSRYVRAMVLMDRIERHASASRWSDEWIDKYTNHDLFG